MINWLKQLFSPSNSQTISNDESSDRTLILETQLQQLKLELKEKENTINNLQAELKLQQQRESEQLESKITSEKQKLFNEIASSLSQLITQQYLLEVEAKPVKPEDIFLVIKRLTKVFEKEGLNFINTVGEVTDFDPNYHQSLNSNVDVNIGDKVIIKIVGISYQNQVIKSAIIQKVIE
ncbi:nucleotide exchange factor GrpE [Cyanobacterium aponinum UTEX 3222]|uniref:nucleotide exchange factor GrpE n=1 Tax=Cyanobacterium aponinum TaxID=379064 RepID=UPI00308683FF|nr:nucleotide exchange factor GrpE [Cyanobacterium aponinum UTEX 3222]